ncbi:MAG: class I SAM-dependent methyltransferase [Chloroflexi bacterium]|nr:class I SAM-dependent methyltransferase [Chloroflexota bacterium]
MATESLEQIRSVLSQAEQFDQVAHEYDSVFAAHIREHYLRKRAAILDSRAHAGLILDVGCGTGLLAETLRQADHRVIGVDTSLGMLLVMQQRSRGPGVQASATQLPFGDSTFDLTFCVALLHHLGDPTTVQQVLGEMVRVTKSGGHIVVWDHNPGNPYWKPLMQRVPQDKGDERLVPLEDICALLNGTTATVMSVSRSGFVPDFTPPWLLSVFRTLERALEAGPLWLTYRLLAHNVVVAQKR